MFFFIYLQENIIKKEKPLELFALIKLIDIYSTSNQQKVYTMKIFPLR